MVRVHVRVQGRVQGVSFRYYTRMRAVELGLGGWVRNCHDGSVEAVAEGEDEDVERFLSWIRRGPSLADVTGVEVARGPEEGVDRTFRILG